jgi:O-antigen/teichoic acid export membrane protein
MLFSQAYRMAVYPLMATYAIQAPEKLQRVYLRTMRYLGTLALPMVVGITLLAPPIVDLVFGSRFQPTTRALIILMPSLLFFFLNVGDSRLMFVNDRQGLSFLFLIGSVATNLLLNVLLDPSWGAVGAATARLCSSAVLFLLSHIYVARRLIRFNLLRLLSRAAFATATMGVVVWAMRASPLALIIGTGILAYGGALLLAGGVLPEDLEMLRRI